MSTLPRPDTASLLAGERLSDIRHHDLAPLAPRLEKKARAAIDQAVLQAAHDGVRTAVICPTMIYGVSPGLHAHSIQVPLLIETAKAQGAPRHIGTGDNVWSTVHIADLADLYARVLDRTEPGVFYFAENGEVRLRALADAIGEALGQGTSVSWPVEQAAEEWGTEAAHYALGSNSRVQALAGRQLLGWAPHHDDLLARIISGYDGLAVP